MKISYKHQTKEKTSGASCSVTEHALNSEILDAAIATITGRHPDARRVVNQQCDELVFIAEGEGKIVINDVEYKLSKGDVVLIEAGEKYFWEGNMKLFLSCRPAWKESQQQHVD